MRKALVKDDNMVEGAGCKVVVLYLGIGGAVGKALVKDIVLAYPVAPVLRIRVQIPVEGPYQAKGERVCVGGCSSL